ncbi:MAG TPA: acetoin utilization protein AcuC [Actinomycetota bacterium]|nr:acetoin utilization protein AcuC [Actinomycetota bacterium]
MSASVALITVDDIARAYDFGSSHPLRPERVLLTYERIRELGLTRAANVSEVAARPATDEEIGAVHDSDFIACVKDLDAGRRGASEGLRYGLGTPDDPIFKGMHKASAAVSGASVVAAELILSGTAEHSFNPAGGLHHARAGEASGFCIYNDPAVAIAALLRDDPTRRVMYIDVDVHHGDGVQWIFYDEPRVATLSLHESGHYLYPGTGFESETGQGAGSGTSLNVPLAPFTSGEDYLWALEALVVPAAQAFAPDVLVTQLGADTHHGDPLANLGLTMAAYPPMTKLLHEVAHRFCDGAWLATGGGGYQFDTVVPKVWTIHFAEMCGAAEVVPQSWLEDLPSEDVSRSYRADLERSVEQVLAACCPKLEAAATASAG